MGDEDELTPLGHLLEEARGTMSKRAAAKAAGISEGRWRQIVTGQQKVGGGLVVPAKPKRATVAAMAAAVGADVDEALRLAGFEPAPRSGRQHVSKPDPRSALLAAREALAQADHAVEEALRELAARNPEAEQ